MFLGSELQGLGLQCGKAIGLPRWDVCSGCISSPVAQQGMDMLSRLLDMQSLYQLLQGEPRLSLFLWYCTIGCLKLWK